MDRCEICGARWNWGDNQQWGRHNMMVLAAFRYCLGRTSYIVTDCVDWLLLFWDEFDNNLKNLIIKETIEAIEKGNAGDKLDVESWNKLINNTQIEEEL